MALNQQELLQSYQMLHRIFPEDLHIVRPFIHMLRQRGENKLAGILAMDTARRMLARGKSDQAISLLTLCKQLNHPDNEGICTLSGMAQFSSASDEEQGSKVFDLTRHLSDSETMAFIRQGKLVKAAANEEIVRQGESSRTFYLILDGTVDVRIQLEKDSAPVSVKQLTAGDFFGEFACIYQLPRSATIVAKGPVLLLEFSEHSIEQLIRHSPMAGDYLIRTVQNRMVHAMTHILPAFKQIPEEDHLWIAEESTIREYDDGSPVIEEESENPACHILLTGKLELKLPNGKSTDLTSGAIFGDINPYIRIPPQASLQTKEHALVCNMPEKIFNSFMNVYPSFGQYLKTQQQSLALH